jgi:hypothetical protein
MIAGRDARTLIGSSRDELIASRLAGDDATGYAGQCPRQDSNLRTRFRKPMLYPLSYEGGAGETRGLRRARIRRASAWPIVDQKSKKTCRPLPQWTMRPQEPQ